jgi:hypothetical protein
MLKILGGFYATNGKGEFAPGKLNRAQELLQSFFGPGFGTSYDY